ncbi:MAG: hypothetical protein LBQ47_04410, partial [Endomicrobium sp.]|nr:hypothetical protein [Endomicrobium sp.]
FSKINGFTIEFHLLDIAEKKFEEITDILLSEFYVAHVHANNYGNIIDGAQLPETLEITFINKAMIKGDITLSSNKYPIKNLDFPCDKEKEDIALNFTQQ